MPIYGDLGDGLSFYPHYTDSWAARKHSFKGYDGITFLVAKIRENIIKSSDLSF